NGPSRTVGRTWDPYGEKIAPPRPWAPILGRRASPMARLRRPPVKIFYAREKSTCTRTRRARSARSVCESIFSAIPSVDCPATTRRFDSRSGDSIEPAHRQARAVEMRLRSRRIEAPVPYSDGRRLQETVQQYD